jgi:hypothetical protein
MRAGDGDADPAQQFRDRTSEANQGEGAHAGRAACRAIATALAALAVDPHQQADAQCNG